MSAFKSYFGSLKNYPTAFWLLCINMLVFMISFNMILPEMNEYLTDLGGADKKWMILGLWTMAAAISRPFSGKIADNISRKSVMFFGISVSILICLLYPYFITVTGFLILRFLHGFSTGFQPTGVTALVADIIPKGKRGEAMGLFGVTISIGFSGGQAIGSPIKDAIGIDGLFMTGAIMGLFSMILLFFIVEKKKENPVFNKENHEILDAENCEKPLSLWQKIIPKVNEVIAPEVIQPSVIMFLSATVSGVYMMTVPDFSDYLKLDNKGVFYLVNVAFMVVTRIIAGRFYDIYGARKNLYLGLALMIVGVLITGTSTTVTQFLFSSIVFGIAASICSPALFAWTADLANPKYKGRGMSTMFIALELGIAFGAYLAQLIYNNNYDNFFKLFAVTGVVCFLGIVYLYFTRRIKTTITAQ